MLTNIEDPVRQYDNRHSKQKLFTYELFRLIKKFLRQEKINVHLIEKRTKTTSSFRSKISRPSKSYSDPLNEVKDLTGIRVIANRIEDIDSICQLIEKKFDVDWEHCADKRIIQSPEEFGYQSVHYVVKIPSSYHNLLESSDVGNYCGEIQVRTILQHAWAGISHKLQYKREQDIPPIIRRKLSRLSALLEIADSEFSLLEKTTMSYSSEIKEKSSAGSLLSEDINLLTVEQFIQTSPEVISFENQAEAAGFNFEKYRSGRRKNSTSDLVALCYEIRLKSISDIRDRLVQSLSWSEEYFNAIVDSAPEKRWGATPAFLCALILIVRHIESISADYLIHIGWHREIAEKIMTVAGEFVQSHNISK